jgi:hypothetical protein
MKDQTDTKNTHSEKERSKHEKYKKKILKSNTFWWGEMEKCQKCNELQLIN